MDPRLNTDSFRRENALLAAMNDWRPEATTVGGYGASTQSIPRYSVDLDLVIKRAELESARAHLTNSKLKKVKERVEIEKNYGGSWERWEGGPEDITVDLLVDSVTDRTFKVPFSYEEIRKDAQVMDLIGIRAKGPRMLVASREVLIVLKVQPMRTRDIGDIACLAAAGWDADRLNELLARVIVAQPQLLRERLAVFATTLGDFGDDAEQRLGPRVPGPARNRIQVLKAAKKIHDEILRQIPD